MSFCRGGVRFIWRGTYYLDNRYRGGQYYRDNNDLGVLFIWGYHLDVTPAYKSATGDPQFLTQNECDSSPSDHQFFMTDHLMGNLFLTSLQNG